MTPNLLWLLLFYFFVYLSHSQWSLKSDLFISGGNEMHIAFYKTYFLGGKIITARSPEKGIVSFAENSSWERINTTSYVDGIVRIYHSGDFDFPTGNASIFSPISVRKIDNKSYFQIQYVQDFNFQSNPPNADEIKISSHFWLWDSPNALGSSFFSLYWSAQHKLYNLGHFSKIESLKLGVLEDRNWRPLESLLAPNPWLANSPISLNQGQLQTLTPVNLNHQRAITFVFQPENFDTINFKKLPLISQVLTPNEDGLNDEWKIENFFFENDTEIHVYNRHGRAVYRSVGQYEIPWKGYHFITGKKLPQGSYFYILSKGSYTTKGWVYLKWE